MARPDPVGAGHGSDSAASVPATWPVDSDTGLPGQTSFQADTTTACRLLHAGKHNTARRSHGIQHLKGIDFHTNLGT